MDGNGRWAQERGKERIQGHLEGVGSVRRTIEECCRLGIEQLTLYCFSTENWKRPAEEINFLMALLKGTLSRELSAPTDVPLASRAPALVLFFLHGAGA